MECTTQTEDVISEPGKPTFIAPNGMESLSYVSCLLSAKTKMSIETIAFAIQGSHLYIWNERQNQHYYENRYRDKEKRALQ